MQEALGREEDRGGDTDLIDNLSPLQFLKDGFVFIPIIRDSLIYIFTLSLCHIVFRLREAATRMILRSSKMLKVLPR